MSLRHYITWHPWRIFPKAGSGRRKLWDWLRHILTTDRCCSFLLWPHLSDRTSGKTKADHPVCLIPHNRFEERPYNLPAIDSKMKDADSDWQICRDVSTGTRWTQMTTLGCCNTIIAAHGRGRARAVTWSSKRLVFFWDKPRGETQNKKTKKPKQKPNEWPPQWVWSSGCFSITASSPHRVTPVSNPGG